MSSPTPAWAQPTAYVVFNDTSPCAQNPWPDCWRSSLLKATLAPGATRVDWVRAVPQVGDFRDAYVTPDGGTVVWLAVSSAIGPGVFVHNVSSGETRAVAIVHGASFLIGNPARPEVSVALDHP